MRDERCNPTEECITIRVQGFYHDMDVEIVETNQCVVTTTIKDDVAVYYNIRHLKMSALTNLSHR